MENLTFSEALILLETIEEARQLGESSHPWNDATVTVTKQGACFEYKIETADAMYRGRSLDRFCKALESF
jgi:hypothetical protein